MGLLPLKSLSLLPPALRVGPDISTCPVCGRLLVVRTHA